MKLLITILLVLSITASFAQKAMNEYTLQELIQKKSEAESKSSPDAGVYNTAITLKKEIDEALKVEDYDKAAATKEKLAALKLNSATSAKAKELQAAIDKAVAEEDYDKARILKTELTTLTSTGEVKKVSNTTNSTSTTKVNSVSTSTSTIPPVTKFTKDDIYTAEVTFMGLDYSLFTVVSTDLIDKEDIINKHIPFWQKAFVNVASNNLRRWINRSTILYDRAEVESLYKKNLDRTWIVTGFKPLMTQQLQDQVFTYPSKNHGLGLVFIQGAYDEITKNTVMYVVWYDTYSKVIVHSQEIIRPSRPSGFAGRWLTGIFDASDMYSKQFKSEKGFNMEQILNPGMFMVK